MADQTIPDYETIRAAVTGETWAVEKVLMCYKDEIDRQATVKKRQPDGTFKLEIDEDMRQYITMKLIEALPQFLLMTKIIDTTGVDDDWTCEQRGITWETPILLGISRFY